MDLRGCYDEGWLSLSRLEVGMLLRAQEFH